MPPSSKPMRPPLSEDVSVGEVVPQVDTNHHSVGELSSGIRVLLDPPDKHARRTSKMSPGEIAVSGQMGQRRTINGVDVITVGSTHHHRRHQHHLQSAPDSSLSVGEVVRSQDETLASLESTVELAHSGRMEGMTSRATDEQLGSERRPKVGSDKGETEKTPTEEEIQTEYQTDTFTSMGLTQESSDFPLHQRTNGLQLKFAGAVQVEGVGGVKGRVVTKEGETRGRQVKNGDVKEERELKARAVTEEGGLPDGSSSQLPSAYQDDTFQTTSSLQSSKEQSASKEEEEASRLEAEKQEKADPSNTDDFILTISGSDTSSLSF